METGKFPVTQLLRLYSTHRRRMYLNNFREFKLFLAWLEPIQSELSVEAQEEIPWYLHSYELQELSKHLKLPPQVVKFHLDVIYKEKHNEF